MASLTTGSGAAEKAETEGFNPDLTALALFADGPPWDTFRRLRDEQPAYWNAPSRQGSASGFWSLTRYEDIERVGKDWETFSSQRRGVTITEGAVFPAELEQFVFVMMDPPAHDKHRSIVQKVFTPRAIAAHEPEIRRVVTELIDAVLERGDCDFVEDIAVDFPLTVIADMLGVPPADRRKLFEWTNMFADTSVTPEAGTRLIQEMGAYVGALVAERRAHPREDLLSRLIHAEVDGESLTDFEVIAHFAQLMAAGNETTRNSLAGGVLALAEHPDQRRLLIDDPSKIPAAVEEILRWHTPVLYQARTATRPVDVGGVRIEEDELVVLWFASANRDPRAFERADQFDVERTGTKHLSFGGGRHYCLGNQLARLELRVALEEILRRMPNLDVTGDVVREPSNVFHWLRAMPVTFTATRHDERC
jgi:cytochrome P450